MIILKVTENPGFTLSLEKKTLFEHKYLTNYSTVAEQ